jgi:hypothetical protein
MVNMTQHIFTRQNWVTVTTAALTALTALSQSPMDQRIQVCECNSLCINLCVYASVRMRVRLLVLCCTHTYTSEADLRPSLQDGASAAGSTQKACL